ncbi:MAG TPA: medium chain dehydrogenase/reductase family protein [Polyangiaceae bacterium]|jgi:NADPH:quinone reductase-like Zn-dependent oxidoreductase
MERYRAVMLTRRGGPEVLETVDLPVREPGPGEARLRVRATGAGGTDVTMRRGRYAFAPPIPFVPGYEVVGDVEALGRGVTGIQVGDRVAALVVHGGYAERIVRPARELIPVPAGLDDGLAVALILNYVTAYQAIHRVARVQPGQTALVTGANGGVGTALLDLLRLAGARVFGAAGRLHHEAVREAGAIPIDGRTQPIDRALREVLPAGVDVAFDGLGGRFVLPTLRATRRGGHVVGYGFSGAGPNRIASVAGIAALLLGAPLAGRRSSFYGITLRYRRDPAPFREDLATLFGLLAAGRIRPRIAARLPLLAAREASEWLERGGVQGKIVHLASA